MDGMNVDGAVGNVGERFRGSGRVLIAAGILSRRGLNERQPRNPCNILLPTYPGDKLSSS